MLAVIVVNVVVVTIEGFGGGLSMGIVCGSGLGFGFTGWREVESDGIGAFEVDGSSSSCQD